MRRPSLLVASTLIALSVSTHLGPSEAIAKVQGSLVSLVDPRALVPLTVRGFCQSINTNGDRDIDLGELAAAVAMRAFGLDVSSPGMLPYMSTLGALLAAWNLDTALGSSTVDLTECETGMDKLLCEFGLPCTSSPAADAVPTDTVSHARMHQSPLSGHLRGTQESRATLDARVAPAALLPPSGVHGTVGMGSAFKDAVVSPIMAQWALVGIAWLASGLIAMATGCASRARRCCARALDLDRGSRSSRRYTYHEKAAAVLQPPGYMSPTSRWADVKRPRGS